MNIFGYHYAYIIDYFHVKVNRIMKIFMQKGGVTLIYEKIKRLCAQKGVTIYRLEKDLEFSPSTIIKWKTSVPAVNKLKKVSDYLGVNIEYFLEEDKGVM